MASVLPDPRGQPRVRLHFLSSPTRARSCVAALRAMDETGALGVVSKVDRHWFLQFGTAIFFGVLDGLGAPS